MWKLFKKLGVGVKVIIAIVLIAFSDVFFKIQVVSGSAEGTRGTHPLLFEHCLDIIYELCRTYCWWYRNKSTSKWRSTRWGKWTRWRKHSTPNSSSVRVGLTSVSATSYNYLLVYLPILWQKRIRVQDQLPFSAFKWHDDSAVTICNLTELRSRSDLGNSGAVSI